MNWLRLRLRPCANVFQCIVSQRMKAHVTVCLQFMLVPLFYWIIKEIIIVSIVAWFFTYLSCLSEASPKVWVYGVNIGYCIEELLEKSDTKLFGRLTNPAHCLHPILPSYNKSYEFFLRKRGHTFTLLHCTYNLYKNSFLYRCLFRFV